MNLLRQTRSIASSGIFKILLVIGLVMTGALVFNNPKESTIQEIGKELLSEHSELGQYLNALVEKKTHEKIQKIQQQNIQKIQQQNIQKIQQKQSVPSKVNIPPEIDGSLLRRTDLPPLNSYWSNILHFIPEKNSHNCLNLFTTESSKFITLSPGTEKTRAATNMSNFAGSYLPEHRKLMLTYQELARQKFVHTVCEIGFNVGQNAISWLTAKPGVKYYGFDKGLTGMAERMGRNIKKFYPGRFNLMLGDLAETVPKLVNNGLKCDIISVDGGHDHATLVQDLQNLHKAASSEHIIVLDDIYFPAVNKAWKQLVGQGTVHHLFDCWLPGMDVDVALGYYNPHLSNY